MTTLLPTERPILYSVFGAGEPISGVTEVGDMTGVQTGLDVVSGEGEMAYLQALVPHAASFPPLPDSGWLEAGAIYQHGDKAVLVRQTHNRTEHDPASVPALFMVYREDAASVLEWVAGESVQVGTIRTYQGTTYECIQAHVTEKVPPDAPALWAVVHDASEPQPWVRPTGAHDVYKIGARVTHKGATWECTAGDAGGNNSWEPGVYGWTKL